MKKSLLFLILLLGSFHLKADITAFTNNLKALSVAIVEGKDSTIANGFRYFQIVSYTVPEGGGTFTFHSDLSAEEMTRVFGFSDDTFASFVLASLTKDGDDAFDTVDDAAFISSLESQLPEIIDL